MDFRLNVKISYYIIRYILEVLRGRGIGTSRAQTATLARWGSSPFHVLQARLWFTFLLGPFAIRNLVSFFPIILISQDSSDRGQTFPVNCKGVLLAVEQGIGEKCFEKFLRQWSLRWKACTTSTRWIWRCGITGSSHISHMQVCINYIVAVEESVSFIPFRFSEHFATEICPKARGRESWWIDSQASGVLGTASGNVKSGVSITHDSALCPRMVNFPNE